MPSITGNVGGSAGSGATVTVKSLNGQFSTKVAANGSGDYTVTVADRATYVLSAQLEGSRVTPDNLHVPVLNSSPSGINFYVQGLSASNETIAQRHGPTPKKNL